MSLGTLKGTIYIIIIIIVVVIVIVIIIIIVIIFIIIIDKAPCERAQGIFSQGAERPKEPSVLTSGVIPKAR